MKIIAASLTCCFLAATSAFCEEINKKILENLVNNTSVSSTIIDNAGLRKCFAATFHNAEISVKEAKSANLSGVYAETADGMQRISEPGTTAALPELLKLVKPEFKLQTEADGEAMLSALRSLFTKTVDDRVVPSVVRKGSEWSFIMGTFFKKFSGFVAETDASGKIIVFKRSLEITK